MPDSTKTYPVSVINRSDGKAEKNPKRFCASVGLSIHTKTRWSGDLRSASDNVAQSSDSPAGKITNDDGDDTIDETPPRMEFI